MTLVLAFPKIYKAFAILKLYFTTKMLYTPIPTMTHRSCVLLAFIMLVSKIIIMLPYFPENKTGSYINFLSKNNTRAYFEGKIINFHLSKTKLQSTGRKLRDFQIHKI